MKIGSPHVASLLLASTMLATPALSQSPSSSSYDQAAPDFAQQFSQDLARYAPGNSVPQGFGGSTGVAGQTGGTGSTGGNQDAAAAATQANAIGDQAGQNIKASVESEVAKMRSEIDRLVSSLKQNAANQPAPGAARNPGATGGKDSGSSVSDTNTANVDTSCDSSNGEKDNFRKSVQSSGDASAADAINLDFTCNDVNTSSADETSGTASEDQASGQQDQGSGTSSTRQAKDTTGAGDSGDSSTVANASPDNANDGSGSTFDTAQSGGSGSGTDSTSSGSDPAGGTDVSGAAGYDPSTSGDTGSTSTGTAQ